MNTVQVTEHLITIPYEATGIRSDAKALGARWRPATKQWAMPTTEAATTIREQIEAFEGASPMSEGGTPYEGPIISALRVYDETSSTHAVGEVLWEEEGWECSGLPQKAGWVTVLETNPIPYSTSSGRKCNWFLDCRPATAEEIAERLANRSGEELRLANRAIALAAAAALLEEARADREQPLREDPRGSEHIYEVRVDGFSLSWCIEPEGTEGRSVIYLDRRDWHEGASAGRALPWTAEREAIIRAAGEHWNWR